MRTRLVLLAASAAALLSVQPAAAQGLPYELQFGCTFQNNFASPLASQDCDNEQTNPAAFAAPERMEERPMEPPKIKKKIIYWLDPYLNPKDHGQVMQHDTYGSPSGNSASTAHSSSGVAGAVSNTVSRATDSVGGLLD